MNKSTLFLSILLFFAFKITLNAQNEVSFKYKKLDSLARAYNNLSVDYLDAGEYDSSGKYIVLSIKIKRSIPGYDKNKLANGYFNLGNIKNELGLIDSALFFYRKAEDYLKQLDNPNRITYGSVLTEIGECYIKLLDFKSAIPNIKKGIELIETNTKQDYCKLILARVKLSQAYMLAGLYPDAISYSEKTLELSKVYCTSLLATVEKHIGSIYYEKKDFTNSIHHQKKAKEAIDRSNTNNSIETINILNNIGSSYQKKGDYAKAEEYFRKGLNVWKKTGLTTHSSVLFVLNNLGVISLYNNKFDSAIKYYEKALLLNSLNSNLTYGISYINVYQAAKSYEELGEAFSKLSLKENDSILAKQSIQYYQKAIDLSDDVRFRLTSSDDKLIYVEKHGLIYDKAIVNLLRLSKFDSTYIHEAYKLISKRKSAALNDLIISNKGFSISGIPNSIKEQELSYRKRLDFITNKLYEKSKQKRKNIEEIKTIEDQLFKAQEVYREFVKDIEKRYPKYFSLKFDTSSVSINYLQDYIGKNEVVIDFFKTDTTLYTFAISKKTTRYSNQKLTSLFYNTLLQFNKDLVLEDFSKVSKENVRSLATNSYSLYCTLLKPIENNINNKKITIIPYNELSSIPFACLLTRECNNYDFFSLPYLVKSNSISYSLSSKLYIDGKKNMNVSGMLSSLSVSPTYQQQQGSEKNEFAYRQNLNELPGAKVEAEKLKSVFHGSVLTGEQATEQLFKKTAPKYSIIHLAMHTFIDDKNPNYSKLIFSQSNDTIEDGYLNAYEIYNLKLNCQLAILSACRSGDGNLIKGEGIISIARGFFYIGCPSIVTTQWRVDDLSGSEIVGNFAKEIEKGENFSSALQKAQIQFIDGKDPLRSHPYFWAAYQVLGTDNTIRNPNSLLIQYLTLFFIAISAIGYFILKYLKSN